MANSGSAEITVDVGCDEAMPNENMEEMMMSRGMTKQQQSRSKVMRELMEMKSRHDMESLDKEKEMHHLMEVLESSTVDDDDDVQQNLGNKKMRELMEMQFRSSLNDTPFSDNLVRIMYHELYEVVCDKTAGSDKFVYMLEQVCTQNEVDLTTIFDQVTPTGDSLLHVAAQHGSEQVARLIASHYPKLLCQKNFKGDTPLHLAARGRNLGAIIVILDMVEKHFMTTTTTTTSSEKEEGAESMDKETAFIMSRNNYGMTALHEAVLSKDYSVVLSLLLAHEQSVVTKYWTWNCSNGCKSPMYLAVLIGEEDILNLLLRLIPIPINKAIPNGYFPLHAAISERNAGLLMMMVDAREELLYQRDENMNTPLHYAAYAGYLEGVCIMLEKSPTVAFQRNSDGNLPIHLACGKGRTEVVKKLLETKWPNAGFMLNTKGQNILHIAAMKGQNITMEHLLKHPKIDGDTINERDVNGETPLHLAARELRLWTLLLLSHDERIDVNIVNNQGFTARDVVWMQRRVPVVTRQELQAEIILRMARVSCKATEMLGTRHTISKNKEWNVKEAGNTLLVVAILVATVSFTAGITVPGGFYSSDATVSKERGLALLSDQTLFKIFMAFNTVAMYSSTIGSVILLWVPVGDLRLAKGAYGYAQIFVDVALMAMSSAFLAAVRLLVSNNALLAHLITAIGLFYIFIFIFLHILPIIPVGPFSPIGELIMKTIFILVYGSSDVRTSDIVGKINQADQIE